MSSVGVTKSPLLTAQVVDPVPSNEASPFEAPNFEVQRWDGLQPYWPLLIPYVGCLICPCIATGNVSLVLEEEEAVLTKTNLCCQTVERRPYAQLGEVVHIKMCGCVRGVKTNLGSDGDKGSIPICPGCGCAGDLVQEIHDELQRRKIGRGNIAQLKQMELTTAQIKDVNAKLDVIMSHMNLLSPPSAVEAMERTADAQFQKH